MYHVSAQSVDERMANVHYYYQVPLSCFNFTISNRDEAWVVCVGSTDKAGDSVTVKVTAGGSILCCSVHVTSFER